MLLRHTPDGIIAIAQPGHAWLAGQMARAWGNHDFAPPTPFEDLCFAIEQHDIGWLDEDRAAPIDAKTGLPREFWDVPAVHHTALWSAGVKRACLVSRYAAVLISLHGVSIYDLTFDAATASKENADAVTRFRVQEEARQNALLASLRADPCFDAHTAPAAIDHNRRLLLALDTLSLHLCWGIDKTVQIDDVPTTMGQRQSIELHPGPQNRNEIFLRPWPFLKPILAVRVEGRQVDVAIGAADTRKVWTDAPAVSIDVVLKAA